MERIKRLPDAELSVMLAVWETAREEPASRAQIAEKLTAKSWNAVTLNTLLMRLTERGFLEISRNGRANCYRPLVSREEYLAAESRSLLDRLYGSSIKGFVAAMCEEHELTREELDELREYLNSVAG